MESGRRFPLSSLTIQTLLKHKLFGDYTAGTRPLQYRAREWQELVRGKERAVRLITKSMLGVPSAHHGDQDHPMWCFQFENSGLLVVFLHRGNNQIHLSARNEEASRDLREAVDFLLAEMAARLRQL